MADDTGADVFVYTGIGDGGVVPQDVVRVRIDPSVLVISEGEKHKIITLDKNNTSWKGSNFMTNCVKLAIGHSTNVQP